MNKSRMGGLARARALSQRERSRIARRAANKRWQRRAAGIVSVARIRSILKEALGDRKAKAFLFGSYARGEATPHSDIDIMVVEEKMPPDWMSEVVSLRRSMRFEKKFDLVVIDQAAFDAWKGEYGTIQHEVAKQGLRLV